MGEIQETPYDKGNAFFDIFTDTGQITLEKIQKHVHCLTLFLAKIFVCSFDYLRPINNLSVKQGRVFLG